MTKKSELERRRILTFLLKFGTRHLLSSCGHATYRRMVEKGHFLLESYWKANYTVRTVKLAPIQ